MLNFNSCPNHRTLGQLKNNLNYEETRNNLESVYKNSEALSNHISNNILESLKEQLNRQGLQVHTESEKELETSE